MVPQAQKSAAPPVIPSPPSGPSATHPPVFPSAESAETSRLGRDRNWEATSLLGARGFGSRKQNTPFFSQCHWEQKHPRYWRVIPVVYQPQLLFGLPGNSWKAQQHPALLHAPFACLRRRRRSCRRSGSGARSVSSPCPCERGVHSPCGFPGLARAPASPLSPVPHASRAIKS